MQFYDVCSATFFVWFFFHLHSQDTSELTSKLGRVIALMNLFFCPMWRIVRLVSARVLMLTERIHSIDKPTHAHF